MQPSNSNNVMTGMMVGLLLSILLIGLVVLNSYLVLKKASAFSYDYTIAEGFDFSNGKLIKSKILKDKTIVWTKTEKIYFSDLYAKYNLHHDKPLIRFFQEEPIIKNYFVCVYPIKTYNWWRFWEENWHFFKDISCYITWTAQNHPVKLFWYLDKENLPLEEVQDAYREFVRVFDDDKKCIQFCLDFIDSHEKQATIDLVANIAQTGNMPPGSTDWSDIGRRIMKYRSDFPDDLPTAVMNELSHTYLVFGDWNWHPDELSDLISNNLLNNYLLRPTEFNALHAILHYVSDHLIFSRHGENRLSDLDETFKLLHKHGFLEKCLSQVYSDDVETPPLPAPAIPPASSDDHQRDNIYYTDTYENLPQREKLLKISCFPEVFKTYWEERLKKLQEKQKAQ